MDAIATREPDQSATTEIDLVIGGMTCASCVRRVERALQKSPGVAEAAVNLATERARVRLSGSSDAKLLVEAVRQAGYEASLVPASSGESADQPRPSRRDLVHLIAAACLSAPLLAAMAWHLAGAGWMLPGWVQFGLATPVQFWLGARFYVAGWKAARAGAGNMDQLVALGSSAAWGLSTWSLVHAGAGQSPALYYESAEKTANIHTKHKHQT
jgi:Cu+-exporting ATPase